jgi:competence protein ComGC
MLRFLRKIGVARAMPSVLLRPAATRTLHLKTLKTIWQIKWLMNRDGTRAAFTVLDLLVIVAMVSILSLMVFPALTRARCGCMKANCVNNLKQVGLAFKAWGLENQDKSPTHVSFAKGGAAEMVGLARTITSQQVGGNLSGSHGVYAFFLVMSNELSTPKVLACPNEFEKRRVATTFAGTNSINLYGSVPFVSDANISYAVGVDASDNNPRMLMTVDHNIGSGDTPSAPYLSLDSSGANCFSLGTKFSRHQGPGWMNNMHVKQGNVGLADGSVEQVNTAGLRKRLSFYDNPGAEVSDRFFPLAPGCISPGGVNRIMFP